MLFPPAQPCPYEVLRALGILESLEELGTLLDIEGIADMGTLKQLGALGVKQHWVRSISPH